MPRLPNPPGTMMPSALRTASHPRPFSSSAECTQAISTSTPKSRAAWLRASRTLMYASCSSTYFPTRATLTVGLGRCTSATNRSQGPHTGCRRASKPSRSSRYSPTLASSSISGTSYKISVVTMGTTARFSTSQNRAILSRTSSSNG